MAHSPGCSPPTTHTHTDYHYPPPPEPTSWEAPLSGPLPSMYHGLATIQQLFESTVGRQPGARFLGWRPLQAGRALPYEYATFRWGADDTACGWLAGCSSEAGEEVAGWGSEAGQMAGCSIEAGLGGVGGWVGGWGSEAG